MIHWLYGRDAIIDFRHLFCRSPSSAIAESIRLTSYSDYMGLSAFFFALCLLSLWGLIFTIACILPFELVSLRTTTFNLNFIYRTSSLMAIFAWLLVIFLVVLGGKSRFSIIVFSLSVLTLPFNHQVPSCSASWNATCYIYFLFTMWYASHSLSRSTVRSISHEWDIIQPRHTDSSATLHLESLMYRFFGWFTYGTEVS